MNIAENAVLQQLRQMTAAVAATLPQTGNKDKPDSASFQDMMEQTQQKDTTKDSAEKPAKDEGDETAVQEEQQPAQVQKKDKEELRPEEMAANPNAVNYLDLFRPEIAETVEEPMLTGAPVQAIPEEAVEETGTELNDQMPTLDTTVGSSIEMEMPAEEQTSQESFQTQMEEVPQTVEETPEAVEKTETAPEQTLENDVEVRGEEQPEITVQDDSDEPTGEAAETQQPVFHEAEAAPVKVGERYEVVDTQEPDMEAKLADNIRQAVQAGAERVEIRLNPQNLGTLTIEMTKDSSGALQVVLHASNSRAAGLLGQHLDGLHAALQSYGTEQQVHVEVQRSQESQQQSLHQQTNPDGRGQNQQQRQEQHQEHTGGQDFLQKLRLGLFGEDENQ